MKKNALLLAAAVVLIVLLAGCERGGKASGPTTAGTKTPITFVFFNQDATEDMPFNDPIARKITEATGVTLRVDHPVSGDTQAIPLMVASGAYPDLIFAKGQLNYLVDAGAVLPLEELINKRGENIKKLYGDQLTRLRNSTDDPNIYTVGTYPVRTAVWKTDGTMQLQHAVLKDQGYPRMRTLDDYERAIKAYMAKYPTINGRRTIGFSLLIDTWQWYIDLSNPSGFLIGYPDDGQWLVNQTTLQAQYKFLNPETKTYYKWLNRMNQEGVLDPESFTQKEDEWRAKIASGRVLGIAYPDWGYGDAKAALVNDGMADRTYTYLPIMANESYRSAALKDYGFSGGWGISITASCKDPERAFEFLDWMCSEEAQILANWGIEGENYQVVNGKRFVPPAELNRSQTDPEYQHKTGIGRWLHPFPMYGPAYIDSTGNFITRDSPETIKQNYLPVEKETLAAYGAEMWIDLFPSTESLGVSKHGAAWQYTLPPELNAVISEADDLMKTALSNMVLGRPENFDAAWDTAMQELRRIGIENANREMTSMIQEKIRLWSR